MRSLDRPVSVKTVATELANHILDLVVWAEGSREALRCREVFFFVVKNRCIEFCVNTTDGLGAEVTLQTYGRTEPPYGAFYVVKVN
jgi:hypothetical protein